MNICQRGEAPIEYVAPRVKMIGEALDKVLWSGRQWAVTDYGIEALSGQYNFSRDRLMESSGIHGWPAHMAAKNWVDIDDFITAWLVGIALHGQDGAAIRKCIARSWVPADA